MTMTLKNTATEIGSNNFGTQVPEFVDFKGGRFYFGLNRSHMYLLANAGKIKAVSLRRDGTVRGRKLFVASSIRDYLLKNIQNAGTSV